MGVNKTWRVAVICVAVGAVLLSVSLCAAHPASFEVTPTATGMPAAHGQNAAQATKTTLPGLIDTLPATIAPRSPYQQPETTDPPQVSLFTILTPARCLILGLVGGVVFILVYGIQIAILRRLR